MTKKHKKAKNGKVSKPKTSGKPSQTACTIRELEKNHTMKGMTCPNNGCKYIPNSTADCHTHGTECLKAKNEAIKKAIKEKELIEHREEMEKEAAAKKSTKKSAKKSK